jgi:hypothetical protein
MHWAWSPWPSASYSSSAGKKTRSGGHTDETGRRKVLIEGESVSHTERAHHRKAHRVGIAEALIVTVDN